MKRSFKEIAHRLDNAERRLVNVLAFHGELDEGAAQRAANLYLKNRIAKLSPNDGQFTIKHGAFLERDVIERAAAYEGDGS